MDGASITSDPKESPVSIDTETHTHIFLMNIQEGITWYSNGQDKRKMS